LTAELVREAPQYINPLMQRELGLRGYKIQAIENLGATQDQYQAIDMSDNEIIKVDNFPQLKRLETILLSNNRVCRIATGLGASVPELATLNLTNNELSKIRDLDALSSFTNLTHLTLTNNPVCKIDDYRLYAIHRNPKLKVLDFAKVKPTERDAAKEKYGELDLEAEQKDREEHGMPDEEEPEEAENTFTPGEGVAITQEERQKIMAQIASANSLEEIERLEQLLKGGAGNAPMRDDA